MSNGTLTDSQLRAILGDQLLGDLSGTMGGTGSTGGFFNNLGNLGTAIGGFLGGQGGQLIGAGLSIDELNKITDIAQTSAEEQARIGQEAQTASAFKPFTVSTGFGGVTTTPTGGVTTTLAPSQAAQFQPEQQLLSSLTPAISIADLARTGQQLGAKTMAEANISGLEDLLQAETVRSQNLRDIYSSILGAQATQAAAAAGGGGGSGGSSGMISDIANVINAIGQF